MPSCYSEWETSSEHYTQLFLSTTLSGSGISFLFCKPFIYSAVHMNIAVNRKQTILHQLIDRVLENWRFTNFDDDRIILSTSSQPNKLLHKHAKEKKMLYLK